MVYSLYWYSGIHACMHSACSYEVYAVFAYSTRIMFHGVHILYSTIWYFGSFFMLISPANFMHKKKEST